MTDARRRPILRRRTARRRVPTTGPLQDDTLRLNTERLRSAVEAAEVGTWVVDLKTGRDTRDPSLNRILGFEPIETTQENEEFFDHIHEVDRDRARTLFDAAVRGTGRYDLEMRIRRPSGEVRWVRDVGRICRGADGDLLYAAGAMTDITELKVAHEALAESAFFYRQTLESLPGMTFTASADGDFDYVSQQWAEFTGVDKADVTSAWELFHPDDRGRAMAAWRAAVTTNSPYDLEYRVRRRDGAYEWFKVRGRALRDSDGKVVRWIATAVNINDLKQTEGALRESEERFRSLADRLRDADRRKDEFLATLAHELRNPLAPIRAGLDVLKQAQDGVTRTRVERTMERQLGHLVRLVDDLLDVSRISRGQIELQRAPLSLAAVIDAALETSRPVIEAGGHRLTVAVGDEPLWVDGDLTRLAQVVSNLLNNAAKYTHPGGRIEVDVSSDENDLVVRITDTGSGIDEATLPRVFDLFARGTNETVRTKGGLGIGLSLVRDLVRMHGGSVSAESPGPGRGSTFAVRLPRASPPRATEKTPGEASPAKGAVERYEARRSVLVVDDNVDAAEMLATMLELRGHQAWLAHDGPSALERARQTHPDLVLLDIGLPGMDGYEVARRLRGDLDLSSTYVVALTGWGSEEDKARALAAGFDMHLTKPIDGDAVERIVRFGRR